MNKSTNPKAVASLVLGILSVIFMFFSYFVVTGIIGMVFAVVGIVLGVMARKEEPSGMATAGLVISLISLILTAIVLVCCVALIGTAGLLAGL